MAISADFQAQLDRLAGFVNKLEAAPAAQDAEDTAALSGALDTAGADPLPAPEPPPAA